MTYSYNRLWKLLIDRGMTKTELKSIAGVSTNIIAKMGKNEPISINGEKKKPSKCSNYETPMVITFLILYFYADTLIPGI